MAATADEASDVVISVVDASNGTPIALARIVLNGYFAYTDSSGKAIIQSVPSGVYRALVTKHGYTAQRSRRFEVLAQRATNVDVRMGRSGAVKTIGSVSVSSAPSGSFRTIGEDDPLRYLDGSLQNAVGDLPGLTLSENGISIDGLDASQTDTSINGVSVGGGGDLASNGINGDLFAGASATSGAANGSLAGNVNFYTLQPTLLPQEQAILQYGNTNSSAAVIAARGSVNTIGYVVQHAVRGQVSALTDLDYTDLSGKTYVHDGDDKTRGDQVVLQWSPALAETLQVVGSSTQTQTAQACYGFTAIVPCGSGPGLSSNQHGTFLTLKNTALIGATSFNVAGSLSSSSYNNAGTPYFLGTPTVDSGSSSADSRFYSIDVQLPAAERHDISLGFDEEGTRFNGVTTSSFGKSAFTGDQSFRDLTLYDHIHPNGRLNFTFSGGLNHGRGSSSVDSRFDLNWKPINALAFQLTADAGSSGSSPAISISGSQLPDPSTLTFDCTDHIAVGSVTSSTSAVQRSSSLRGRIQNSSKRGRIALTAYSARLGDAPMSTILDLATFGSIPNTYLQKVADASASPLVCADSQPLSLAARTSISMNQIARGATAAGLLLLGKVSFSGYAQSTWAPGP